LFTKTSETLKRLGSYHPALQVERMPRRRDAGAAMNHLESHLFANPRQVPLAEDSAGIEIVPAAGAVQEIEAIARRIKGLLVAGDGQDASRPVPAQDILVVFRSLTDVAETIGEVFAQFGVPVAIGGQLPLGRSPLAAALLGWLRLVVDDWPFRQVLAMLGHNGFRPDWPEWQDGAVVSAQRAIYTLQIPSGKDDLLAGIDRLARHEEPSPLALRAQRLVRRMARMLERLPREATLAAWREAISELASSSGLLDDRRKSAVPPDARSCDRAVWDTLLAALAAHEHLGSWLGEEPRAYTLPEYCEHLVVHARDAHAECAEILRSEPLPVSHDDTGCVRVLSAEQARNLSASYVFLAGLSEKAFPPAAREDCVLGEADTSRLIQAGLPLVSHADRPRFEMLLFYEVVTRATRRLVLSYPALDARAQPLSPSPYLTELEQAFGLGRVQRSPVAELTSVPDSDDVLSMRELRVRAVSQALAGQRQLLEGLCRHPSARASAENLLAGLEVSRSRQQVASFGPYEGVLTSPSVGQLLAQRFGKEHCWSPSQLEQYAYCPYQFLLAHVLRIEPLEELEFEVDHRGRGQMLHWLLSALHRQLNESGEGQTPGAQSEGEFLAAAEALVGQFVAQAAARGALRRGMLEIDARRVSAWLAAYHAQHRAYDQAWANWETPLRPAHFEVAFGPRRRSASSSDETLEEVDPLSTEEAFELECRGETIRFAGRIDRIDVGQVGEKAVFNIVDYKSGKPSKRTSLNSVLEGRSLQLPLYALAAQSLLAAQGAAPFRAAFWHVAGEGYREKEAVKFHHDSEGRFSIASEWDQLDRQLRVRVKSLVEGIRGGQFPMHSHDDECTSRCAYRTVCRINQARSLGKQWQPPEELT
jgi:RecB family exonuclease